VNNLVSTSCQHCVFAKWRPNIQIGCQLGRLDKFGENAVLGKEFYTINRCCSTFRDQSWEQKMCGIMSGKETLVELVKKEVELKIGAIIYVENHTDEQARTTLTTLVDQQLQPKHILLCYKNERKPIHYMNLLRDTFDKTPIDYKLERILNTSYSVEQCLDSGLDRLKNIYCVIYEAGFDTKQTPLHLFNSFVNDECQICSMVLPTKKYNGLVIQKQLYKHVGGFGQIGLVNKVQILEKEQECQITKTWDQVKLGCLQSQL
jgi:predicted transcriptional regulator